MRTAWRKVATKLQKTEKLPVAREQKQRRIHYRRAKFMQPGGPTLQVRLESALSAKQKARDRKEPLGDPPAAYRLINSFSKQKGMLCGHMFAYSDGMAQLLFINAEDDDSYPLEVMVAEPDAQGRKREFLDSILHFGVFDDHVVLLQAGLRGKQLEQHLNWLLRANGLLEINDGLALSDQTTKSAAEQINSLHVKNVRFGMPIVETLAPSGDADPGHAVLDKLEPMFDLLKHLFGPSRADRLKLEDAASSSVKAQISLSLGERDNVRGQNLLDVIATSLRDVDEDTVAIELNGGGQIKGTDLKLFRTVTVVTNNGIVDPNDLYPKMQKWLSELVEQSTVSTS